MAVSEKKKRRVILRLIPDFVSLEELQKLLQSYGAGETFTIEYLAPSLPEKMQNCAEDFGRAYLKFKKVEDIPEFKAHFEAEAFVHPKNEREYRMQVEWAPFQHNFELKPKKPDRKAGTVYDMDIYKRFVELKEREAESLLEREQSMQTDAGASATDLFGDTGPVGPDTETQNPVQSPLVAYLLAKHEKRKKEKFREKQRRRRKKREKDVMVKKRMQDEAQEEKAKRKREKNREQKIRRKEQRRRNEEEESAEEDTRGKNEEKSKKNKIRRRNRSKKVPKKEAKPDSKGHGGDSSKEDRSHDPNGIPSQVPKSSNSSSSRGRRRKRGRGSGSARGGSRSKGRGRGRKRGRGRGKSEETSV